MRFFKKLSFALLSALSIVSCSDYDDTDLWNEVNSIKERVTNIESQLSEMNRGIQSLQTLVNAISNNVYIVSVTQTADGYEIVMSNGQRLTIRNGKDGAAGDDGQDGDDGETPIIGVQMVDGVYYWTVTINGKTEFLTDDQGNMIPTTGKDGGTGGSSSNTPIIKVDYAGYWIISYDGGVTFNYILDDNGNRVKATGESAVSFFQDVYQDGDYIVFVLANGTVIRIKSCECGNTTIEDVVPPEILDQMDPYMNIYRGTNPPNVEGTYFIDPYVTVYCQDEGNGGYSPGDIVTSEYICFLNQDNSKLTLDFKQESSSGSSYEKGDGSFISGEGNNFTVYFDTVGESNGISTKTAVVISGTKSSSGILNLEYAFVMVEKGADPEHVLMEEGVFRVFKDQDGLAVNANHSFNFAPAKSPANNGTSYWFEFIKRI